MKNLTPASADFFNKSPQGTGEELVGSGTNGFTDTGVTHQTVNSGAVATSTAGNSGGLAEGQYNPASMG